jgi:hypothetical protein
MAQLVKSANQPEFQPATSFRVGDAPPTQGAVQTQPGWSSSSKARHPAARWASYLCPSCLADTMLFIFAIDHGARVRRLQRLTLLLQLPQAPNGTFTQRTATIGDEKGRASRWRHRD